MAVFPARSVACLLMALAAGSLSGCAFLAGASEATNGKAVVASYTGLDNHSLAIVTFSDFATVLEYPGARQEIGAFVTSEIQKDIPTAKLLNYKDVLRWQDDTHEWQGLPVKDIGKHFSVDRVLYIELLEYSTRDPGGSNQLRGHIHAKAYVYEVDNPGIAAAWDKEIEVYWPTNAPESVLKGNDDAVRSRVLEVFSEQLVGNFYNHRDLKKPLKDRD